MDQRCGNCDEVLRGPYCHVCGQKRFADGDRRFGHLVAQAFEALTDLDGRFWGSLRALLLQPGRLSRDYLAGRRARWMTPTALFLLANVLYFLAPGLTDFALPLHNQERQTYGALAQEMIEARIAARAQHGPYTRADYAPVYDAETSNVGKALIFVHVPVLALGLMLAFRRARLYFAEHLVVAVHQFAFVLLYIQLVIHPAGWLLYWLGIPRSGWLQLVLVLPMAVWITLALRRVYACSWPAAILWPFALNALLIAANLLVYRPLQFLITFALT